MATQAEQIEKELMALIENDELVLPTLPEIALKARETAEDANASASDLAKVISNDAAMTARIIQVANSPILRGAKDVDDVQKAIARLGMACISNIVTGLAMSQMFQATSELIDKRMRENWSQSTEIAGISAVLARHYTKLRPDQATLAGLVHNIGVLPILKYAEDNNVLTDSLSLDQVIEKIHPRLGTHILKSWDFPEELISVPENYLNFDRDTGSDKGDLADIVCVANLQTYLGKSHPLAEMDWATVNAFARLGLNPEVDESEEDLSAEMEAASAAFR